MAYSEEQYLDDAATIRAAVLNEIDSLRELRLVAEDNDDNAYLYNPETEEYDVPLTEIEDYAEQMSIAMENNRALQAWDRANSMATAWVALRDQLYQRIAEFGLAQDEEEEEEAPAKEPYAVIEDPEDGTMMLGVPESRLAEYEAQVRAMKESRGNGKSNINSRMPKAMDKNTNAELQREEEMAWYRAALDKRQEAITKGAYGFDGSGMSRWAMSAEYQQAPQRDRVALRLSERRAKQNWAGAKVFRPFWSNGPMG